MAKINITKNQFSDLINLFNNVFSPLKNFVTEEEFLKINDYNKTLDRCHSTVGIAILNTSITIVFGFAILILSNFIPTIYFGVFTGIAMLLAMVSVLTLLPRLIINFKPFEKDFSKL